MVFFAVMFNVVPLIATLSSKMLSPAFKVTVAAAMDAPPLMAIEPPALTYKESAVMRGPAMFASVPANNEMALGNPAAIPTGPALAAGVPLVARAKEPPFNESEPAKEDTKTLGRSPEELIVLLFTLTSSLPKTTTLPPAVRVVVLSEIVESEKMRAASRPAAICVPLMLTPV